MTANLQETFTIERELRACRAHVFAAWSQGDFKRRWFVEGDGPQWSTRAYQLDFRVGGWERGSFVLNEGPGAGEHRNESVYLDIVPGERIVYAYTMALDGRIHSASLATVLFADHNGGTRLRYTEQGAFFPPSDCAAGREQGWVVLLGYLQRELERQGDA